MNITIIGAGIGGLTTAIALQQKGFEVEIFEAFSKFKALGSGINLANNAMQVYKKLGLYETIYQNANPISAMSITDPQLNVLSAMDMLFFEKKYGVSNVAIHRSALQEILLEQIPPDKIHLGKKLKTLEQKAGTVQLYFEDGSQQTAEVVIGADGIHSAVRTTLFGHSALRSAGQICWRGITDFELPDKYQHQLLEPWGKGKRFGFVGIGKNKVYWYALHKENKAAGKKDMKHLFDDFSPLVNQIISSTPVENILQNTVADLKPLKKWYKGNVCLIGDAAHATTPNLGQGACQAIESAYVLAETLHQESDFNAAFARYELIRKQKAGKVTDNSWRVGKMAHIENAFLIKIRNFLMKSMPQSIGKKQSAYLFEVWE